MLSVSEISSCPFIYFIWFYFIFFFSSNSIANRINNPLVTKVGSKVDFEGNQKPSSALNRAPILYLNYRRTVGRVHDDGKYLVRGGDWLIFERKITFPLVETFSSPWWWWWWWYLIPIDAPFKVLHRTRDVPDEKFLKKRTTLSISFHNLKKKTLFD